MTRNKPQAITTGYPLLQWGNGKDEARERGGRFSTVVGWHIEQGSSPDLDAAGRELALNVYEFKHRRDGGKTEVKPHWWIGEEVRIFPLTAGPVADTMRGAARVSDRMATEAGIVATWDDGSYLSLLAIIEINGVMLPDVVRVSARSHMTDHLLAALLDHLRVCEAADAIVRATVAPWWLALPLGGGAEFDVGREQTTTIVPVASLHPVEIDRAYLERVKLPTDWRDYAAGQYEAAVAWAQQTLSARRERAGKAA